MGPAVGGALVIMASQIHAMRSENPFELTTLLMSVVGITFMSYVLGTIPAAVTGAWLGLLRRGRSQVSWSLIATLSGGLIGFMSGLFFDLKDARISQSFVPTFACVFGAPSAFSALVCSFLIRPINPSPPTDSERP